MPESLCCGLNQLALTQLKHKASCGELLDSFKCVLYHLLLSIPIDGSVIQVDDSGQGTVAQHAMKDTVDHKLKMGRCLSKAHWHPKPLELTWVGNKGQVVRRSALKWVIVEASL